VAGGAGRIFISYRREDTSATAGRLYDRLEARFGTDSVFMDVDSIAPGYDFAEAIESAVGSCQAVLAVIGTHWLDDPDDFVALEIKAGLDRDIPVIPVLVGGAPGLSALARRQSLRLDHDSFTADFTRLLTALERTFARGAPSRERAPVPLPAAVKPSSEDVPPPPTRMVHVFADNGRTFYAVAFSLDGQLIAGANDEGTFLWDFGSRVQVRTINGHTDAVTAVAFGTGADVLATASRDRTVRLWDAASGEALHILIGHTSWVTAVAFSPDGRLLASGSFDSTVRLWDPASGDLLHVLDGHEEGVTAVAFSPNDRLLATASYDKTVRLWDLGTGRALRTLIGHTKAVSAVAFAPGGARLATGGLDKTVRIWDLTTVTGTWFVGGASRVNALAYRPDGRVLAAACTDKTVRLWDPTTGGSLGSLKVHGGLLARKVNGVAFSSDGQTLASAGDDWTVRLWA
jgi:WD40 repeat protein